MLTFEQYEQIALEAKKYLYDLHVEEQKLEIEYLSRGGIHASGIWAWRTKELDKIEKRYPNQAVRRLFLESWAKGNFSSCDSYYSSF